MRSSGGVGRKRKTSSSGAATAADSTSSPESSDEGRLLMFKKKFRETVCSSSSSNNSKFSKDTQFVLGKNVNEIYAKFQQQQSSGCTSGSLEPDEAESHCGTTSSEAKSIYSKYPELFRYEADAFDRAWLNQKAIIKRKNLKCYLLALDDVITAFKTLFKLSSESDVFDRVNEVLVDELSTNAALTNSRDLFIKKLKPFSLHDITLYKLNREYFLKSIK